MKRDTENLSNFSKLTHFLDRTRTVSTVGSVSKLIYHISFICLYPREHCNLQEKTRYLRREGTEEYPYLLKMMFRKIVIFLCSLLLGKSNKS